MATRKEDLKLFLQNNYKNTTRSSVASKTNRRDGHVKNLHRNRADNYLRNRKIEEVTTEQIKTEKEPRNAVSKTVSYREKYLVWKAEREAKKQKDKPIKKPIFQTATNSRTGFPMPSTIPVKDKKPIRANKTRKTDFIPDKVPNIVSNVPSTNGRSHKRSKEIQNKLTQAVSNLSLSNNPRRFNKTAVQAKSEENLKNIKEELNSTITISSDQDTAVGILLPIITAEEATRNVNESANKRVEIVDELNRLCEITPSDRVTRSRRKHIGIPLQNTSIQPSEKFINSDVDSPRKPKVILEKNEIANKILADEVKLHPANYTEYDEVCSDLGLVSESVPSTSDKTPSRRSSIGEYVSPFVTTGRGKSSASKEKINRQLRLSYVEDHSPQHYKVEAEYYRTVLDNEIIRLMKMHDEWETYKTENSDELSEDSCDLINVALGQTNLLINNKFEQFRRLINQCAENSNEVERVMPIDLAGFWDMIFMQVVNLDKRFDNLSQLKKNGWAELAPAIKPKQITKKKTVSKKIVSKPNAKSNIRALIEARRKNKNQANNLMPETEFDAGFYRVVSPKMKIHSRRDRSLNRSMLSNVLNSEASKKNKDTSVVMMSVTSLAKSAERNQCKLRVTSTPNMKGKGSPARGILKTPGLNKSLSSTKAVLFRRSDSNERCDFDETLPTEQIRSSNNERSFSKIKKRQSSNNYVRNSINLISWDSPEDVNSATRLNTPKKQTRMSTRLNHGVLS